MTLDTLFRNHFFFLLVENTSVLSKYFRSFMFLCPILLVMGVNLLQFLGIWFIKTTADDFKNHAPFPSRRNRVYHVDSSQSEMTYKRT